MPIIEMKKVFLLAHREEREKIFNLLHRLGTVELEDVRSGGSGAEFHNLLEPEEISEVLARLDAQLGEVRYCLDFLQRHFPQRKSFVQQFTGGKLKLTFAQYRAYTGRLEQVKSLYTDCRRVEEKLARIRNEETYCRNLLAELEPWSGFDLPLSEVQSGSRVLLYLAAVPADTFPALKQALAEKVAGHYVEEVSADREMISCFFIFPAVEKDTVQTLFKEAAAAPVAFPGFNGTAAQSMRELEEKLAALAAEREAVREEIETLLEHRPLLMACYDCLANEREKYGAVANAGRTEASFLLEGWVPAPALEDLRKALEESASTAVLVAQDPGRDEEVPVLLHNRGPAEPFEVVTRLYGMPHRDELDPTRFLAPFFWLFFGICLSDAVYGFVLSLAAFFILRKLKLTGMGKQLINLLFLGGISSFVFGVLMGGWCGDLIKVKPIWFNPLDDPMRMLIFSFALGMVHIYYGMGLRAYRSIKAGRPLDALCDQGLWFLFLTGLVLMLLPDYRGAAKWVALAGALGLVLTQGRRQKGLLKKIFGGLVSLYDVTGYLSDVLSYSRLLALGLATGVIATAINTMGGLLAGSIFGFVIMVLLLCGGHLFNLVISALGSYVHTSRLQYIEFFGKFFDGGGRTFRPFAARTQFIDVVEKEPLLAKAEAKAFDP